MNLLPFLVVVVVIVVVVQVQASLFSHDTDKIGILNVVHPQSDFLGFSYQDHEIPKNHKASFPNAALLLCYSSSCGHCIHYAPIFRNLVPEALKVVGTVMAMDCDEHRSACTDFKVDGVPTLLLLDQFMKSTRPTSWAVLDAEDENILNTVRRKLTSDLEPVFGWKYKELIHHDAAMSIRFGLSTGVFLGKKVLNEEEFKALDSWLFLLSECFPGHGERLLLRWLLKEVRSLGPTALTDTKFDDLLESWKFPDSDRYINSKPESQKWWHCSNDEERGGFPCGLWLLFHILSANSRYASPEVPAYQVAQVIHGFIFHFFSCTDCRENFLKKNPRPENILPADIQSSTFDSSSLHDQLMLWFWNEHNQVSHRLNEEDMTEYNNRNGKKGLVLQRPRMRSSFPSKHICPQCYQDSKTTSWDKDIVKTFLHCQYSFSVNHINVSTCDQFLPGFMSAYDDVDGNQPADSADRHFVGKLLMKKSQKQNLTSSVLLLVALAGFVLAWHVRSLKKSATMEHSNSSSSHSYHNASKFV